MKIAGKEIVVVDIEADGLLDEITKVHILGWAEESPQGWLLNTATDYGTIKKLCERDDIIIVGHNFIMYDKPALLKVYPDIEWKAEVWDTLFLTYTLEDYRTKSGLEALGEEFGIKKVEVADDEWQVGDYELMKKRVLEDVKINTNQFLRIVVLLKELYEKEEDIIKYIRYINYIPELFNEQLNNPFTLDIEAALKNKDYLQDEIDKRVSVLKKVMPPVAIKAKRSRPKNIFKKDGSYSKHGKKWFDTLEELGLPRDHSEPVEIITGYKDPNPQSISQVKDWLLSNLGWEPCTYKDSINVKGEVNKVPQLKDENKDLVPSIKKLIPDNPELKALEDLSIIQHRLGYVKAFLESGKKVVADVGKLTASTRVAHRKPIVNLPSVDADYGEYVRPLLTCDDGYILCGSDISSLENYITANLTWKYNPKILDNLTDPDYDGHLEMAVYAGMLTQEEVKWYKENKGKEDLPESHKKHINRIYQVRHAAKTVNYSALYGIGTTKLSKDLGITKYKAKKLLDGFWKMNSHIKKFIRKDIKTKVTSDGRNWAYSPISKFWLPIRAEHKMFNMIVQSTGMYIFVMWTHFIRQRGWKLTLNMHDEVAIIIKDTAENKEKIKKDLHWAMEKINKIFNFKAPIGIEVQFGKNYGEIH